MTNEEAAAAAAYTCWLDALPLDLIDAHIAGGHVWNVYHLAFAYRSYADYCRRRYADANGALSLDDVTRRFAMFAPCIAARRMRRGTDVFNDQALSVVTMPTDHPRLNSFNNVVKTSASIAWFTIPIQRLLSFNDATRDRAAARLSDVLSDDAFHVVVLHSFDDRLALVCVGEGEAMWCRYGVLHRDGDRPARIVMTPRSRVTRERIVQSLWIRAGIVHRDHDKPAAVITCRRRSGGADRTPPPPQNAVTLGVPIECLWYKWGEAHRDDINDLPAAVYHDCARYDIPSARHWYKHGVMYRSNNKPSVELFDDSGRKRIDDDPSRPNGVYCSTPLVGNTTPWLRWFLAQRLSR